MFSISKNKIGVYILNETINLIHNRRSIRSYEDRLISQENINLIINTAMRSPTAGNMMLYSIIEVEDQQIKDKLVKFILFL